MNTTPHHNSRSRGEQVSAWKATQIKLGIDVHARWYMVVRQIDNQKPQPAQQIRPDEFAAWAGRQLLQAATVYSCYEAGPFGYGLHRTLTALGVHNFVVCPQDWDERGTGVKTDKLDARALAGRLDRYLNGNDKALAVVRVPSLAEEQRRGLARQRQQLLKERQRLQIQGRSLLLYHGVRVQGRWWAEQPWQRLAQAAAICPSYVVGMLGRLRQILLAVEEQLTESTKQLEQAASEPRPKGLGALSEQLIEREVCDWHRFQNRRQVASYLGLCPGEHSSGDTRRQGRVTKHGNPLLRCLLVELAWRLVILQPDYHAVRKWRAILLASYAHPLRRKKAIVALARQLGIDLWRLATGRATAAQLGLVLKAVAPVSA